MQIRVNDRANDDGIISRMLTHTMTLTHLIKALRVPLVDPKARGQVPVWLDVLREFVVFYSFVKFAMDNGMSHFEDKEELFEATCKFLITQIGMPLTKPLNKKLFRSMLPVLAVRLGTQRTEALKLTLPGLAQLLESAPEDWAEGNWVCEGTDSCDVTPDLWSVIPAAFRRDIGTPNNCEEARRALPGKITIGSPDTPRPDTHAPEYVHGSSWTHFCAF